MVSDDDYRALAVEFAKALVVQCPLDRLNNDPGFWLAFCGDVFNLTDAFADELEERISRRQVASARPEDVGSSHGDLPTGGR